MKYDKNKCEASPDFKGYTGCYCKYCQWFRNQPSKWKAGWHIAKDDCEIFVARKNNRHAFASWGWDGADKLIVGSGKIPKLILPLVKEQAKGLADKLNLKELGR